MNVLLEARQKAIVKTHGVSNHTREALKAASAEPWVQVDLGRFQAAVRKNMRAEGKGVIAINVLGSGRLRDNADGAIQYHKAQPFIDRFTSGPESRAELQGLVSKIAAESTRG